MPNFQLSTKPKKPETDDILVVVYTNKNSFLYDEIERTIFINIKKLKIASSGENDLIFLGSIQGKGIYAVEKPNYYQENFASVHAFEFLDNIDQHEKQVVYRGFQLINWSKNSQYCGCCGGKTHMDEKEFVKICETCDQKIFPQYSPAVIVRISRGYELLLGRSYHFREGMYSVLAGFVEAGESYEDAIHREVHEEVGIKVKNIRYHSSQPWPFPNSQMVGFTAEYESGDLKVDKNELEDANWFRVDELPTLPIRSSIAYNLIDDFVKNSNRNSSFYFGFFHTPYSYFAASFFTGSLLNYAPFLKNGREKLPCRMYNGGVYFSSILFGHRMVRDKLSNYVNNPFVLPMTSCLATTATYFSLLFPISAIKIYQSNNTQNIRSAFKSAFRHTFWRAPAVGLAGEAVYQLYESIYKTNRPI